MPKPRRPRRPRTTGGSPDPMSVLPLLEQLMRQRGATSRRSRQEQADELIYEAQSARTVDDALLALNLALTLDPDNPDALMMMLEMSDLSIEERLDVLRAIEAVAKKRLGKRALKEWAPELWLHLEARPFMRAKAQLGDLLCAAGRLEEAVDVYKEILTLNEGDNQGIRYQLLPCQLALGRLEEARALQRQYKGECEYNVVFAWGHLLERVLADDQPGALSALAQARQQNKHMERYLTGRAKLPRAIPGYYQPGSEEEAQCYADSLLMAWRRYPEACSWLTGQGEPSRPRKPRKGGPGPT